MNEIYKIIFLNITKYKNNEIRTICLKYYDFIFSNNRINIEEKNSYYRLYKESNEKRRDIEEAINIVKYLNKSNYISIFIQDNHNELENILNNANLIVGFNIEKNLKELKFKKEFSIFDIATIYDIKTFNDYLEKITGELENNERVFIVSIFNFFLNKLKEEDEKVLNFLSEIKKSDLNE